MEKLIELITYYRDFTEDTHSEDLTFFVDWLKQKMGEEEELSTDNANVNSGGLDVMISYLVGSLTRFLDIWLKVAYEGLPLISLGDFTIVKVIQNKGNPSKKEIAREAMMERTSCNEALRRMLKSGIIREEVDTDDKRVRRVTLTKEGKMLLLEVDKRMMQLSKLLMGNLTEVEKRSIFPALDKLKNFHENLYTKKDDIDISKLYGLK